MQYEFSSKTLGRDREGQFAAPDHARVSIPSLDFGAFVVAVNRSARRGFGKEPQQFVRLFEGVGIEGDVHGELASGSLKRRLRAPFGKNLRQVHLIDIEFLAEMAAAGFALGPGELGENITVSGATLMLLPLRTRLSIGSSVLIELTGLRYPCAKVNKHRDGLLPLLLDRQKGRKARPKCGVMAIVQAGGEIRPGDGIRIHLPLGSPEPLPIL